MMIFLVRGLSQSEEPIKSNELKTRLMWHDLQMGTTKMHKVGEALSLVRNSISDNRLHIEIFSDYWLSIDYSFINNRSLVVKRKWFLENQFNIRFDLHSRQGSTDKHSIVRVLSKNTAIGWTTVHGSFI